MTSLSMMSQQHLPCEWLFLLDFSMATSVPSFIARDLQTSE